LNRSSTKKEPNTLAHFCVQIDSHSRASIRKF
jgi:hypothetical protein